MNMLASKIRQFRDDEDGVVSIELIICVPILFWALMSTYIYFDAFRAESISTRAGLTIADMYSREQSAINDDYILGSREILAVLTETDNDPDIRVSVFWYDEPNDRLELSWSQNRGYVENLDNNDLQDLRVRIPDMANIDRAILVETKTDYTPPFTLALSPFTGGDLSDLEFDTFTIIRPRFVPQLCFDTEPNNPDNVEQC
jgi:hypothetical protein